MKISLKRVFEINVVVYAFFLTARPLSDPDFWWHLKTGELILRNHSIPRTDIYSFTNFGQPWVAHEWLSELIFYFIYSRFGFGLLIIVFAIFTSVSFWIVFKRCEAHPAIAAVATLLGVAATLTTIGVRPRTFTLLFASIYIAVLTRYTQRKDGRTLIWLIPIMLLWVNMHAGYLLGFVLITIALIGIPLDGWAETKGTGPSWPSIKKLALVFGGCILVAFLNPQGPRIFLFPFEFFFSPVQQNTVNDWLSPNFHDPEMLPVLILALSTIAALALSPKRVKPSELLLFIATFYATLKSHRHVAIFALVAAPLLANYSQLWLDSKSFGKVLNKDLASIPSRGTTFVALLSVIAALALAIKLRVEINSGPRQELVNVPVNAVEFMKASQITGNTFTDPNTWGGYLIWEMPSNPVYIDGRVDMYGDRFVLDHLNITEGVADWRQPFDHYGVRVALLSQNSVLKLRLQKTNDWQQVYEDDMAIVFRR